jgi:hypothetical protein
VEPLAILLAFRTLWADCGPWWNPTTWGCSIGGFLSGVGQAFSNFFSGILGGLESFGNSLLSQVSSLFQGIYSGFANLANIAEQAAETAIFGPIILFLGLIVSSVLALGAAILLAAVGVLTGILWVIAGLSTSLAPLAGPLAPLLADVIFGILLIAAFFVLFFAIKGAIAASKTAIALA